MNACPTCGSIYPGAFAGYPSSFYCSDPWHTGSEPAPLEMPANRECSKCGYMHAVGVICPFGSPDEALKAMTRSEPAPQVADTTGQGGKHSRVKCMACGASFAAEWAGTTCSRCDGDIEPLSSPSAAPRQKHESYCEYDLDHQGPCGRRWMKLPPNPAHPNFAELHREDSWCPKAGCSPAGLCEIAEWENRLWPKQSPGGSAAPPVDSSDESRKVISSAPAGDSPKGLRAVSSPSAAPTPWSSRVTPVNSEASVESQPRGPNPESAAPPERQAFEKWFDYLDIVTEDHWQGWLIAYEAGAAALRAEVDHFAKQNLEWANCAERHKKDADALRAENAELETMHTNLMAVATEWEQKCIDTEKARDAAVSANHHLAELLEAAQTDNERLREERREYALGAGDAYTKLQIENERLKEVERSVKQLMREANAQAAYGVEMDKYISGAEKVCDEALASAPEKLDRKTTHCRDCREPVKGSVHVEMVTGEHICFRCFKRMEEPPKIEGPYQSASALEKEKAK